MDTLAIIKFESIKKLSEYCFITKAKQVLKVMNPAAAGVKVYDFTEKGKNDCSRVPNMAKISVAI